MGESNHVGPQEDWWLENLRRLEGTKQGHTERKTSNADKN